jgi:tRNA pseudouridine38-40 synthase
MPTYRLDLAYDGTDFHGFARQPRLRTVQGELEEALIHHTGVVDTSVAGRTDKGVHATGQVVSFTTDAELEVDRVARSLNSQLTDEIAVLGLVRVDDGFHARFSASTRAYRYDIVNRPVPDPLRARTAWHVREPLDLELMNAACVGLVGEHDFASFCRKAEEQSTIRNLLWAGWHDWSHVVEFSIAANAFCHQVVRSIVAVLVEVGRSRVPVADMAQIIAAADRSHARGTAPPRGLTLVGVGYPGERFDPPVWLES